MNDTDSAFLVAPDPNDFTDGSPSPSNDADLAILCDRLQELGVRSAVVTYDGCGDSGSIDHVVYEPPEIAVPKRFDRWLRDLMEEYCPDGYGNGDGGGGSLTIYPFDGLAEREHSDRFTDNEAIDIESVQLPRKLARQLRRLGIVRITAHFDGYGDSGQFEEPEVEPAAISLDLQLQAEFEQFLDRWLPGGWEINEGSFGDFSVDVASGRVDANASWRVEKESAATFTRWRWR